MRLLRTVRNALPLGLTVALLSTAPAPLAAQADGSFEGYIQLVSAKARAEGVSESTIAAMTAGLTPNQRVIELDRSQPASSGAPPPFAGYRRIHVDTARISGGRSTYQAVAGIAPAVERQYGVPAKVLLAIWGHETNYGRYTGDFDLARSLATLAWEGRRRALFEGEFIALLKMADQGVPRARLKGSWAGAFGNPQFLPSMFLRLARDGDGDGDRDIWNSRADTLASIANYFKDAGWRSGEPWGVSASVPAGFDWGAVATKLDAPTCPRVHARHSAWKPVSEWRRLGINPLAPIGEGTMATLFQPDGAGTPAWLLTGNYRVILHYNCSNYYALSVGLLADEIAR
ncbi:MAG: lytic murein transglycosylase [Novosphingobium sp.]